MANDKEAEVIVIDDEDIADVPALPVAEEGKTIDWQKEAEKYQGMATRRGTKLQKFKTAPKAPDKKAEDSQANKSNELDYGQKAFLVASGYKEADEQALIQEAMTQTGKKLEEVLAMPFVTGQIDDLRKGKATTDAVPKRSDRNAAPTRDTVEYWVAKGELPPADQPELRRKVVNAKIAKAKAGNQFTENPVVGQ